MFTGVLGQFYDFSIDLFFNNLTAQWHLSKPIEAKSAKDLTDYLERLHFFNYSLWHEEDEARRTDVSDSVIARVKRNIDKFIKVCFIGGSGFGKTSLIRALT